MPWFDATGDRRPAIGKPQHEPKGESLPSLVIVFFLNADDRLRWAMRSLGEWNAYVAAGADREERKARLAECPRHFKESVTCHVRTVFEMRKRSRQCQTSSK